MVKLEQICLFTVTEDMPSAVVMGTSTCGRDTNAMNINTLEECC
jgi:hypothetical protein